MGRPLNKKYFGNRNIGTSGTSADDKIGGTAVASVTLDPANLGAYTTRPTTTFSDPDLLAEGGVRATGSVTSQVNIITAFAGTMTGYTTGDIVTIGNGTRFTVTANGGGTITGATITDRGSYPYASGALPTGAQTVTNVTVANPAATGATFAVNYNAKEVLITNQGSGYSHSTDATVTFSQSVLALSVNMLVDSGIIGTSGNQENAITMTAYLTGGSAVLVDIIKQVSTNRYKVTDGTRTGIIKLVAKASGSLLAGEANIIATDSSSKTYYVTKLTAHKATLTRATGGSGWEFETGAAVAWTMNGTSGTKAYSTQPYLATGVNVQIANT